MAALAFNLFRSMRPNRAEPPRYVAGEAGLLKGMSREIPLKWTLLDGLARELAAIAGVAPVAMRPEQQFFPIGAELADQPLRDLIAAELGDLVALLEPAVELLGKAPRGDAAAARQAASLLDHVVAARAGMVERLPAAEH